MQHPIDSETLVQLLQDSTGVPTDHKDTQVQTTIKLLKN